MKTKGIHHITAIAGDPQENVDFYAGVLGLRLVKTTVNFDDPGTYHFYFGDRIGSPGTIMTFFPWKDARKGKIGAGQVGTVQFAAPLGSFSFWEKRLDAFGVHLSHESRFGEDYLTFDDPHGLHLELVEREEGKGGEWTFGGIPQEHAIKGFGGAVLLSAAPKKTIQLLKNDLGIEKTAEEENRVRLRSSADIGNTIDVQLDSRVHGLTGVGTVHHIAWRTADDNSQQQWRNDLHERGFQPTPIIDRQYFHSVYFREPGGILFEMATDVPGFLTDESEEKLGQALKLPPQYEPHRRQLEEHLTPFEVRELKGEQ